MSIELVLASGSPRRRELLSNLHLSFRVETSHVDEDVSEDLLPSKIVEELSVRKALTVAHKQKFALVIGADTIVVLDGQVLGKPASSQEAYDMLERLQGREHQVYSGISLVEVQDGKVQRVLSKHEVTDVWMRPLSPECIDWYISTGEPMDKAGSYGIQGYGACLIEKIHGCYFNVVGMSLTLLSKMMEELGYPLFQPFCSK